MLVPSRLVVRRMICLTLASLLARLPATFANPPTRAETVDATAAVQLANRHLEIAWDAKTGGLKQLRDLATRHSFLSQDAATGDLWSVRARAGNELLVLRPGGAKAFRAERSGDAPSIRLIWGGFAIARAPSLEVEASVSLDGNSPTSAWEFAVRNPGDIVLEEIRFPVVYRLAPQEEEFLAAPYWMGEQVANPRRLLAGADGKGRRLEWHYPDQLSMQCLAYYRRNGPGLYAACDDTAAQRKGFAFWGDEKSQVHLEMLHLPEAQAGPRDRRSLGYRVILGAFCGDWFTAAERYRAWATRQAWAQNSRLQKGLVPDWVAATGLWVWNRGRSPQVLSPAAAIQNELGLPVSVFWHWWHGCAYDAGFPEYMPPREGSEAFRVALARAHQEDIRAIVYMNQRLWGMTTKSWTEENAATYAVKRPDGAIQPEVYNAFTRQPCASMCMGTTFWRNKYAGLAEKAFRDLGVDGIYMDQACSSLACYDRNHGHPAGGGNYWINGFRLLAADIRGRCDGARKVALAGEGCGEAWLPHLDLMLALQVSRERFMPSQDGWEVIPFFHAVYHPYAILYGNYSSLTIPPYDDLWPTQFAPKQALALLDRKFSRQFLLEQARAFVWGQQPTIANFSEAHFAERPEEIGFALRLAKTRSQAAKYLLHGTFLRPPKIDAEEVPVDFSRLSIYAGQGERVQSFQKKSPLVLAAAWRAPDGNLGIALANIGDESKRLSIRLNPGDYDLPRTAKIVRIDASGGSRLGAFDRNRPELSLNLPARAAWLVELQP